MQAYIDYLLDWLNEERRYRKLQGFVVGVSGGIDSAVVAYLLAQLDQANTLGVILPCKSDPRDVVDAKKVLTGCGLASLVVDLTETHNALFTAIPEAARSHTEPEQNRVIDGNARARLRMTTLYTLAQARNALVVGTDNAVEWHTGYFTKFGDGGVDCAPLIHLLKDEVYEMAHILRVPQEIINKPPSAGLWAEQTDEGEIGTSYAMLNDYLRGVPIPKADEDIIAHWHARSHHKRALPRFPQDYRR